MKRVSWLERLLNGETLVSLSVGEQTIVETDRRVIVQNVSSRRPKWLTYLKI